MNIQLIKKGSAWKLLMVIPSEDEQWVVSGAIEFHEVQTDKKRGGL
jgi:hypothetical protein